MSTIAPQPKTKKNAPAAPKAKGAKVKAETKAEQSLGIRLVALSLTLLLILASASYVATPPAFTFMYGLVAISGSYLAYIYREKRPGWVGAIPTLATMVLFTNFLFEVWAGYLSSSASAVGAFIHMLTGLLALHSFDLRTRGDFSISALIGLGLLTCISGMAKDMLFGFYIFTYSILGGLLLFFDSSSRSHEIGPSRSVAEGVKASPGKPLPKRFKPSAITAFIPVILLPIIAFLTFTWMPRIDSVIDIFVDNFVRSKFPIPATLSEQLGKGGRSQSIRGGASPDKPQPGPSYTAQGGEKGTASSTSPKGHDGRGSNGGLNSQNKGGNGNNGKGITPTGKESGKETGKESGSGSPDKNAKLPETQQMLERLSKERSLNEAYERETVELKSESSKMETIILKIASPQATYIRRYTLNGYTGTSWTRALPVNPINLDTTPKLGYDLTASQAFYIPPNLPTLEVKQDFKTEADIGYIMPAAWLPQLVKLRSAEAQAKQAELRIDADGTIKTVEPIKAGSNFTVISQVPVYDLEVMRRIPFETLDQLDEERQEELKVAKSCLDLPGSIDSELKTMAADIAGQEGNWFVKAERICNYLRKNYRYDASGLYSPSETNSTSTEAVRDFLMVKKSGDCRHFATAFAILCRCQGIPTRIVNGFMPGELNKKTGFFEVRGKHAHVWAEIYLPYWNWVPFDAIPNGQLPAHEEGGNPLTRFIKSGLANPFGQTYASNRKGKSHSTELGGKKNPNDKNGQGPDSDGKFSKEKPSKFTLPFMTGLDQGGMQAFSKFMAIGLAALLLTVLLVLYLKQKEASKRKELLENLGPATIIYLDVLDTLKRYQLLKHPTETADELSFRIAETLNSMAGEGQYIPKDLPTTVSAFMALYSEERFGGTGEQESLDELSSLSARIKELAARKRSK